VFSDKGRRHWPPALENQANCFWAKERPSPPGCIWKISVSFFPASYLSLSLPLGVSPQVPPSTTDSSQVSLWLGWQSLGDRRGRAREESAAPAGEGLEVITKSPPRSVS
jgi:hypothetical protein